MAHANWTKSQLSGVRLPVTLLTHGGAYGIAMDLTGLIRVAILISVVLTVAGVGLRSAAGDVTYLLRKPGLLARSLLAMNVVQPLFVCGLVSLLALRPAIKVALVALAVSPLPPFLPRKQRALGANSAYVHALFLTTSLLSILFVPAALALIAQLTAEEPRVGVAQVLGIVTVTTLMPLSLGILVRRLYPQAAELIHPIIDRLGTALLFAALALMLATQWAAMRSLIGDGTLFSIIVVTAFGLMTGHLLGDRELGNRSALALATASRHPGMALAVATASFPQQPLIPAAVLLALLVGMLAALPYTAWCRRALAASSPKCHGK